MSLVGQGITRSDGVAKVTGQALYVDDFRPEGCLHGATVRSSRPRARIVGIELDPRYDWSDVTVVTADDIPGENVVALMTDDQPVLARGEVRHVMEAVALVAAPTRDKALEAAKHVVVHYVDLEPLLDPEAAENHPTRIFGEDNVFKRVEIVRSQPDELHPPESHEILSGSTVFVHDGTYRTGLQEQCYIEPQGMLAIPDERGRLTIIGSLQCPYYVHKALLRILGHDRFHVVQAVTGGGFGGKEEYPSMVAAHAALLASKAGRPVKLIYRRDEDLRATTKRHPAIVRIRSMTGSDGSILRWEVDLLMDGGAYNTLSPVVLSRAVLHSTGPYRMGEVYLRGRVVATNTPPNGAFRGFGAPQAIFAAERHMDRIARQMGIDPVKLRRRNLLRDGDMTATGQVLRDTGSLAVLDVALEAAQAPVPEPARHPGGGDPSRLRRGRGLAMAFHGCGFTGNGEARLKGRVALALEGDEVHVRTSSIDMGQGADTVLPMMVADALGLPARRVVMDPHDTALVPDSGPTVASRTTMVVGAVCLSAAEALRTTLKAETGLQTDDFEALLAARTRTETLVVESEYVGDPSIRWDDATYSGDAYPTYAWSANIVDLDVDLDTGEVLYRRFVSATDVGRAINPVLATGQLEGGALQALGWATCEEVVLDERHAMRNDRLTNYIIPTAADAPELIAKLVEIPYAGGPFGAKGIGEIPMDAPAAAVAQAIENATSAVLDSLPMTPERVMDGVARFEERRRRRRGV